MVNTNKRKFLMTMLIALCVICFAMCSITYLNANKEAKGATALTTLSCLADKGNGVYDSEGGGNGWRFGYATVTSTTIGTSMDYTVSAGIKLWSDWNSDDGRIGLYLNYVDSSNHLSVYFKCANGSNSSNEIVIENFVEGSSSYTSCWPASKQYILTSGYSTMSARCYYNNGYKVDITFSGSAGSLSFKSQVINGTGLGGQTSGNPQAGVMCVQRDCSFNNVNIGKSSNIDGWDVVGGSADASKWSKSGTSYVGTNTEWKGNYLLTTGKEYTGSFDMVAKFTGKNTTWATDGEIMGFVPYYIDDNNYILIYLDWNKNGATGLNEVMVNGAIDGKNIRTSGTSTVNLSGKSEWNDIWLNSNDTFKTVKPTDGIYMKVRRLYDTETNYYTFTIQLKKASASSYTTVATVTITNFTQEKAAYQCKAGFYTRNDTVTISEYAITNYGNNGDVGFANTGNGGYGNQAGNTGTWSYNASTQTLIANGDKAGSIWKGTYALANNSKTSYYFGAQMRGITPDTPVANEDGGSEFRAGFVPYYADGDNSVFVYFFRWSDSSSVTLQVSAMINGSGAVKQSDGTFSEWATQTLSNFYLEAEHYVELQITGDVLNIYLDRSVSASYSYTINGLSAKISSNNGYYGASVNNYGAEYRNILQSSSRIFGTINKPVIYTTNKVTTGYVGQMINIPATCSNGTGEFIVPTVTVKNASGTEQTVYSKSTSVTSVFCFYPTTAGTYTVNITAKDKFGTSATAVSYTITVTEATVGSYTIKYDGNGATSGTMSNQSVTYNTATNLTANAFSKTGYIFSGWATSSTATTATYTDKQSVTSIAYPEETITLYAVWTAGPVTITINVNDATLGSVDVTTLSVDKNTTVSASGNVLTIGSKTITATAKTITGYQVVFDSFANAPTKITENVTITATFSKTANQYTIKFNNNGGSGEMADLTATYDVNATLTTNTFTKTGYTFGGWATTSAGAKAYDDGATVKNLTTENGATITLYAVWTINQITVTIGVNDSTLGSVDVTTLAVDYNTAVSVSGNTFTIGSTTITATPKTITGYQVAFDSFANAPTKITEAITITATFSKTANQYTIKFNNNGGSGEMADLTATYDVNATLTTNAFTRTGYTFGGWATTSTGVKAYDEGATVKNLTTENGATITLYAVWTVNQYTVTIDVNDSNLGSIDVTSVKVDYNTAVSVSDNVLTIGNKTVTATIKGATGYQVTFDSFANAPTKITENVTITATFSKTANQYTIKFNNNGGSGEMADLTATYDVNVTLTTNTFTRTGYTFGGWATTSTGAKAYDDGATVKNLTTENGATINIYAIWSPISYSLKFNNNGGEGEMANQSFDYDESKPIDSVTFTKTQASFIGWATTSNGDVVYTDGQTISNLTTENGKVIELFAKWESIASNKYVVLYNGNGATAGTMANSTFNVNEDSQLTKNDFTRTGYTFIGWAESVDGEVVYSDMDTINNATSEQIKLFACWEANTYTVTLDFNGGLYEDSFSTYELLISYDEEYDLNEYLPTLAGHTCDYFTYNGIKVDMVSKYQLLSNSTLIAHWKANSYIITIDFAGGNCGGESTVNVNVTYNGAFDISAYSPIKTGYTFVNYKYNNVDFATTGTYSYTENITVTANYEAIKYTIKFDNNGGSGEMADLTATYDVNIALTTNTFTKADYNFNGWATTPTGERVYADGEEVKNLTTISNEEVTLYAVWTTETPEPTTQTYTVKFNKNGGTGTMENQTIEVGKQTALTENKFTREGYTFKGWSTTSKGEVKYTDAESVKDLANSGKAITLYAVWEQTAKPSSGGCGSSIDSMPAIFTLLACAMFLVIKKKAQKESK